MKVACVVVVVGAMIVAACGGGGGGTPDARPQPIDSPDATTLTVSLGGAGSGRVVSNPAGIDCGATCAMEVTPGAMVTLTAEPGAGSTFGGWSASECGASPTCAVTVSGARNITATFARVRHAVTVMPAGSGDGSITSTPAGINCPTECTMMVDSGATIELAATANGSSTFGGWTGGGCTGTGTCTLTVTDDVTVTAGFLAFNELLVTKAGTGTGRVTSSPTGIDCGSDCTETFALGTMVTLTAAADSDSTFTGWSGAGCTGTAACEVLVAQAEMVTATFTKRTYALNVLFSSTGTGRVTSSPAGIDCTDDCNATFEHGTLVTLTAIADASSTFIGWGGACTDTSTECTVTVDAAKNVVASFALRNYTLTVVPIDGSGSGTVTSNPAGINCLSDCTQSYPWGTEVTLSATSAADSVFVGWAGAGCTGTGTCTILMTADANVHANFGQLTRQIDADWQCDGGVSCVDLYNVELVAGAEVNLQVVSLTGGSVVRLGAYAPGMPYTSANLLTGSATDRMCRAQNESDSVSFRARVTGTYQLAIGRDAGTSSGTIGDYRFIITSTIPLRYHGVAADNIVEGTSTTKCGYSVAYSGGWTCSAGTPCQDVFGVEVLIPTTATVTATSVTGASSVRLGVFTGTSTSTTNLLTGGFTDYRCGGQDTGDSATTPQLSSGEHRFAIGRDWLSSGGGDTGTYVYTVSTPDQPVSVIGLLADDVLFSHTNTTCP